MTDAVRRLQELIDNARRIVFFGGAGVSTESGIPDFRSVDGLYSQTYAWPPEEILSHGFFLRHTDEFYAFYRDKMLFSGAKPNAAHQKLAEMERAGRLDCVITQNIDGLHQKAGSQHVWELHGSVLRNACMDCGARYGLDAVRNGDGIPRCGCGGVIKPDVVLYQESLDGAVLDGAVRALQAADLVLVGGTSLAVYPAAGLVDVTRGRVALINRAPTRLDSRADVVIDAPIGEVLSQMIVRPCRAQ